MDPKAAVAEARGDVDEALLTETGSGFLGRAVLADDPLIEHLRDDETLHYLLSGPATPTRIDDGESERVDARGSFLTLVAVTDVRVLVVVGDEDGDQRFAFYYGDVVDVELESGLLTETIVLQVGPQVAWRIPVGSGSDARAAVAYTRERLSSTDVERAPESELVDAVFQSLVGDVDRPLDVQQYGPEDLNTLVADIDAHLDRLEEHLASDEPAAARGAAATVEAIGVEGEDLAEANGDHRLSRRIGATRHVARRAIVADAFDVVDPDDLDDALDVAIEHLLRATDEEAFERLVADVWSGLGYQTTVPASTGTGGADVVARRSTPVEQTVVVRAMRDPPDRSVGPETIQQCASLYRQASAPDLVVAVTTGTFTGPAVETATELDVRLVDRDRLVEIVVGRDLYDVVASHVGG